MSLSMIEQMDSCGSYYFKKCLSPMMVDRDDQASCERTSSTNSTRTQPSMIEYISNDDDKYHHRPQLRRPQDIVLPQLRPEGSKSSMNTSFSTTTTTTSIGSNSITFYQSPTKDHYFRDHDEAITLVDPNTTVHLSEGKPNHRGVDRSITLPRETHLQVTSHTPVSTSVLTTISPNRSDIARNISGMISPTSSIVTPEVTRPKKNFQRNASSDSILSMPPLYPISPPQRQTSRSSASMTTTPRRMVHQSSTATQHHHHVVPPSAPPLTSPPPPTNNKYYNIDTRVRTVATMCTSPLNDTIDATRVDVPTTDTTMTSTLVDQSTNDTTDPVMVDLAPGVKIQLRGANETEAAIRTGFYIQCDCLVCSASTTPADEIYCILDCDYFICPTCRSVHPNPISTASSVTNDDARYPGGLGIGFRLDQ